MDKTAESAIVIDDQGDHDLDLCDPSLEERLAYEGVEVQIISTSGNSQNSAVVEDVIVKPLQKGFSPIKVEPKDSNEDDLPEYVEIDDDYDDIKWQVGKGTPEVDHAFTEIDDSGIGADNVHDKTDHVKSSIEEYGLNNPKTDSPDVHELGKPSASHTDKVDKSERVDSVLDEDYIGDTDTDIQQPCYVGDDDDNDNDSDNDEDITMEHDHDYSHDEDMDETDRQTWKTKRKKYKPRPHPYSGQMVGRGKHSVTGKTKIKSSIKEPETKPEIDVVTRTVSDINKQIDKLKIKCDSLRIQIDNLGISIAAKEKELKMISDMDLRKRLENLCQKDKDAYEAVMWLRRSKNLFSGTIYEPIMLCVKMKDEGYRRCLESLISATDMTTFFCEESEDKNLFLAITRADLKLKVNALTVSKLPSDWSERRHPIEDYREYGFQCYLQDMFTCPEPIMKFLRMQYNVQNIPIGDQQTKDLIHKIVARCPEIKCFYTLEHQFQMKKSSYSGLTSTICTRLKEPSLLIKSVDEQRKQELKQQLETEIETKTKHENEYSQVQERSQELARTVEQLREEKFQTDSSVPPSNSRPAKTADLLGLNLPEETTVPVSVTPIKEPPPPMDCEGCHSTRSHNSIVQCCDGHVVCTSCVEKEAKLVIIGTKKGSVSCSVTSCKSSIPQSELRKSLPSIVMDLLEESWQKETLEALANMKDGVQCPGCGYSGVLEASIKNFKCNKCLKTYCRLCETEWQLKKHDLCIKMTKKVSEVTGHTISIPAHWDIDTQVEEEMGFSAVNLDPMSVEYLDISALFTKSIQSDIYTVKKVYRIQNQRLWEKYSLCRTHMIQDMGELHINERRLFHGTNLDAIDSICKEGFDWRLCGQNGTVYGQGTYFAKQSSYSIKYSSKQKGKWTPGPKLQGSHATTTAQSFPPAYTQNLRFNVLTGQPPAQPWSGASPTSGQHAGPFQFPTHKYFQYVRTSSASRANTNTNSTGATTTSGTNVGPSTFSFPNMNFKYSLDPSKSPFVRCNYGTGNPFTSTDNLGVGGNPSGSTGVSFNQGGVNPSSNTNQSLGGVNPSGSTGVSFNVGGAKSSSNTNIYQGFGGVNPSGSTGVSFNVGGAKPSSNTNIYQGFGGVNPSGSTGVSFNLGGGKPSSNTKTNQGLGSGIKIKTGPQTGNVTDSSASITTKTTSSSSLGSSGIDPSCFIFTGSSTRNPASGTSNSSTNNSQSTTANAGFYIGASPMAAPNSGPSADPTVISLAKKGKTTIPFSYSPDMTHAERMKYVRKFTFGVPSSASDSDCYYMFVGRVLVGRKCLGKSRMRRPDKNEQGQMCHTAVDHMSHPHIFVVFDSGQCYPEYLIEISKGPRVGR